MIKDIPHGQSAAVGLRRGTYHIFGVSFACAPGIAAAKR